MEAFLNRKTAFRTFTITRKGLQFRDDVASFRVLCPWVVRSALGTVVSRPPRPGNVKRFLGAVSLGVFCTGAVSERDFFPDLDDFRLAFSPTGGSGSAGLRTGERGAIVDRQL